tara:strand:+ start:1388 stop:1582 length:195 start_codon:yes stop_codon:yes gene_type:complete
MTKCKACGNDFFDEDGECCIGVIGEYTCECASCGEIYEYKYNDPHFGDYIIPLFKKSLGNIKTI